MPYSPLHDGAVVIQNGRVSYAGCILPLTLREDLPDGVGTRHRAAVGLTEETDAVVVVVSEETGGMSVALGGAMVQGLDAPRLRGVLRDILNGERRDLRDIPATELAVGAAPRRDARAAARRRAARGGLGDPCRCASGRCSWPGPIAMVLWGMAHGTSSIERGVDIPIVFDGISEELVLVDQSARAVNIRVLGSRAALRDVGPVEDRVPHRRLGRAARRGRLRDRPGPDRGAAADRRADREPLAGEPRGEALRAAGASRCACVPISSGEPAEGYNVAWVEVDPAYVWLTGDRREVVSMREAITETLEIRGLARADRARGPARAARSRLDGGVAARERARAGGGAARAGPRASEQVSRRRSALFGTDGVRGLANVPPDDRGDGARARAGRGARVRERRRRPSGAQIIIGKDTRLSGYMFEDALAAGICSMGVDVLQVGPMPTPGMAFLTADMRCDAGVMISASHNPYQDNGIKFFSRDGFKLPDEIELRDRAARALGRARGPSRGPRRDRTARAESTTRRAVTSSSSRRPFRAS